MLSREAEEGRQLLIKYSTRFKLTHSQLKLPAFHAYHHPYQGRTIPKLPHVILHDFTRKF